MVSTTHCLGCGLLLICASLAARDLHVNPAVGHDAANGLAATASGANGPVKTIARGLKLAGPGDTVHLAPALYRESAVFHNRAGEPNRPIVLDGHGATLDGSEPLNPADWNQVSPGLYRNDHLLRMEASILGRWFFLFDGRMQHMGRTSKGPSQPLKKPDDLLRGEWTFVKEGNPPKGSRATPGAFHLRIDPARKLADCRIAAPVRSSGVVLSGRCEHLRVRNLTCTHVHNDGFNIHGWSRDAVFENIRAVECGDDGFSAHDDCEVRVEGFVSIGNSTGICNVNHSTSQNRRVFIRDCLGFDFYMLGSNRHTLEDSVIESSSARTLMVAGQPGPGDVCTVRLDNVLIRRVTGTNEIRIATNSVFTGRRLTLIGLNLQATGGRVELRDSVVVGAPPPEITLWKEAQWQAGHNVYDLRFLRRDSTFFSAKTFSDYQRATGQDAQSKWTTIEVIDGRPRQIPAGVGADLNRLPAQ